MGKLKSRKLWMAIVIAALIVANQGFGLHIPEQGVMSMAGVIMAYIFGQAYVDAKQPSVITAIPLEMMTLDTSVQAQTDASVKTDEQEAPQDQTV
ncbi:hypothetical protein [Aneurinibacillus tyrosinisolvens]|uniref:hypothetical protein n=1 Tax=Aneurinibacillus tyrosinisolvens TaxID=1443435 RepID=UPI00063F9F44|nr:hypothetical protein [Aneurinibacillus tyrosinisolvens]